MSLAGDEYVIEVGVDFSEGARVIEDTKNEANIAARQIATAMRRSVTMTLLTLQATGAVVDEVLRVQAQLISQLIETAVIVGTVGWGLEAKIKMAQIFLLTLQLRAIQEERDEAARRLGAAEAALEYLVF